MKDGYEELSEARGKRRGTGWNVMRWAGSPTPPTSSSTYIPLQPFAPFGHRLISQVLRLNLITASGSFPTVFHLQH